MNVLFKVLTKIMAKRLRALVENSGRLPSGLQTGEIDYLPYIHTPTNSRKML